MAKTLLSVSNDVLKRLGDTAEEVWTSPEIKGYIKEGYDRLALTTYCFWDTCYLEDRPTTANCTADWEQGFMDSGWIFYGVFNFTSDMEEDYVDPGQMNNGPTTHTCWWEYDGGYVDSIFFRVVYQLPDDLYQVDRAVWDYKKIEPLRSTQLENVDRRYWVQNGEVLGYLQDKDGLRSFRKWRVPAAAANEFTITEPSVGIMRSTADITGAAVIGTWGIPRIIPTMHVMGDTGGWGLPRRPQQEIKNTRVEYFRRGRPLVNDGDTFELPDRYVMYVRHFATWRALERNGPGQDLKYAAHWKMRFDAGVARMLKRREALSKNRRNEISDARLIVQGRPPLARYPWQYGRVVGYPTI